MTADALALLFRRLVLAAQQAEALARPIAVAEILDTLVPYRAARRDGLLDTNDDYLHAVMQLLAGEGGYVFADDLMQDDLKSELSALNPDLGVLATYRTAKVRLSTARAQAVLAGDTAIDLRPPTPVATDRVAPRPVDPATSVSPVPAIPPAPPGVEPPPPAPPPPAPREHPAPASAGSTSVGTASVGTAAAGSAAVGTASGSAAPEPATALCPYCSQGLPTDRPLKYCPHCGLNLRIRRCAGCSAEMEAEWKFCVTCGRAAP
jgi:hypothetical protein